MRLLNWIKNRGQQPVAEKPQTRETAKEMYSRQAAQEKATPMDRMPPDQQAKVEAIKASLEKATQHIDKSAHAPSSAPADGTGGREAARQNMTGHDKAAPALSPTSAQAAKPPSEKLPGKAPDKPQERPQTVPRPRPSWER